jgi:hypothetical protein
MTGRFGISSWFQAISREFLLKGRSFGLHLFALPSPNEKKEMRVWKLQFVLAEIRRFLSLFWYQTAGKSVTMFSAELFTYFSCFSIVKLSNTTAMVQAQPKPNHRLRILEISRNSGKTFHNAIKPVLTLAQLFGIMPVYGISSSSQSTLKFKLSSLRTICTVIYIIYSSIIVALNFLFFYQIGITPRNISTSCSIQLKNLCLNLILFQTSFSMHSMAPYASLCFFSSPETGRIWWTFGPEWSKDF